MIWRPAPRSPAEPSIYEGSLGVSKSAGIETPLRGISGAALSVFFSIGRTHPIEKKTLKINNLEHVLIGKVIQLFRNML